jgi:hypothetical protein
MPVLEAVQKDSLREGMASPGGSYGRLPSRPTGSRSFAHESSQVRLPAGTITVTTTCTGTWWRGQLASKEVPAERMSSRSGRVASSTFPPIRFSAKSIHPPTRAGR